MNTAIIILAAGASRRFNGIKQLAKVTHKDRLINFQLEKILSLNKQIFLVLGANYQQIESQIPTAFKQKITLINHLNWQQGMGSSIAYAMTFIKPELINQVLITLLDQPCITVNDYADLLKLSADNSQQIICSHYNQTLAVPAIFPRAYFTQLQQLTGEQGAKKIIQSTDNKQSILIPSAAFDIDTRQQLATIRNLLC